MMNFLVLGDMRIVTDHEYDVGETSPTDRMMMMMRKVGRARKNRRVRIVGDSQHVISHLDPVFSFRFGVGGESVVEME